MTTKEALQEAALELARYAKPVISYDEILETLFSYLSCTEESTLRTDLEELIEEAAYGL